MKALTSFTKRLHVSAKKFCCNVLQKSLKEEQRSVFHVFKFPSFRFRRKETFSSFRSNGKGPGLFFQGALGSFFRVVCPRARAPTPQRSFVLRKWELLRTGTL